MTDSFATRLRWDRSQRNASLGVVGRVGKRVLYHTALGLTEKIASSRGGMTNTKGDELTGRILGADWK